MSKLFLFLPWSVFSHSPVVLTAVSIYSSEFALPAFIGTFCRESSIRAVFLSHKAGGGPAATSGVFDGLVVRTVSMLESLDEIPNGGTGEVSDISFGTTDEQILESMLSSDDRFLIPVLGHDGGMAENAAGAVCGIFLGEYWS